MVFAALALFVVSLGYGVVVPLLPTLAGSTTYAAATSLSVVYTLYAAAKIAAQVPGGAWVDRVGPRRVMRVALPLYTVSTFGFLGPPDTAWFALCRMVEGAATGLVYPAAFAAVLSGEGGPRGTRVGTVVALGTSGLLLGPALGGALGAENPRIPVAVAASVAALVTAAAWFVPLPTTGVGTPRTLRGELDLLRRLCVDVGFLAALLPIAFNKLSYTALQGLLPLYGAEMLGLGPRRITAIFALTGIGFGVAQVAGGWLADRLRARAVVLVCLVPLLGGLALMGRPGDVVAFAAGYGVYVLASSVVFTATLKHAAETHGSADTYGGMYGLLGTATDLMTVVGPAVFLNAYRARASSAVFTDMAATGLVFAVVFAVAARRRRTP
ncbi:MAG: MFS transporter [Deltaproteobacteria bacterium]|nr:MFS transporter [Deltaproteobacteria bacterium]